MVGDAESLRDGWSVISYDCSLAIGQGVFPVLFFSGVMLALVMFNSRVSECGFA